MLLGLATTVLPLGVAAAVGWWSSWVGFGVGVAVSVGFGVRWARASGKPVWMLGIVAGAFFSLAGSTLLLPSLRVAVGALPTWNIGAAPPAAMDVFQVRDGRPRTELIHLGTVLEHPVQHGRRLFLYPVIAPLAPAGWDRTKTVPAWAVCEAELEEMGHAEEAKRSCVERFGSERAIYANEIAGPRATAAEVSDRALVAEAMETHGLKQRDDAPVFVLQDSAKDDALPGIIVPLVASLLCMGFVAGLVDRALR